MKAYKEDQGRLGRMAAFWSVIMLLLFGCTFLHTTLLNFAAMKVPLRGIRLPVVGVDLTGAFLVSFTTFVIGAIAVLRWQQTPKVADLLIDTENELRKVTWPSSQEVVNSAIVVVVCVMVLLAFVALCDWVLGMVLKYLLVGRG